MASEMVERVGGQERLKRAQTCLHAALMEMSQNGDLGTVRAIIAIALDHVDAALQESETEQ